MDTNTSCPESLQALQLPLWGERLIEASAGTGKTFTIVVLYLRLLLRLGGDKAYIRPLKVEEILIVTFTEAAKEELKERIRINVHRLRIACIRGYSDDAMDQELLNEITDLKHASIQLLAAERQMDEASIYTIHGFCQRILSSNAFESGILFEQTLINDELPLRRQACADFWRRYCYPLSFNVARIVSNEWSGPEKLLNDIAPYLQGDLPKFHPALIEDQSISQHHQQIVIKINELKKHWLQKADKLYMLISSSSIDKRIYSSTNLVHWLTIVNQWSDQETSDYFLPKALAKFRQSVLYDKTKQGNPPEDTLFLAIDQLFSNPLTLRDLIIKKSILEIRAIIQKEKRQRSILSFDDLLSSLDTSLQESSGESLTASIRRNYPFAMIDEFQDTDPKQYRIFHHIYANQEHCGLLLIGDPKQAIYSFRGADIFTYILACSKINARYTLLTNWRSSHQMVRSVNTLFNKVNLPFLFKQIPFIDVVAAKKNSILAFEIDKKIQPALHFWLQEGEKVNITEYQQLMAQKCAAQIRDWLTEGQNGRAKLITLQGSRPVKASDITILVRNRTEAMVVRKALNTLEIPSIYLSSHESVFDSQEAKDLFWLLKAVLTPEKECTLRCAMATRLIGVDLKILDKLNNNEQFWDELIDEFHSYQQTWKQHGILPMLREIIARRKLAENLLASPGGERRLTDLLHLGELLQTASLAQLNNEHSLVRWIAQKIAHTEQQDEHQQLRLESSNISLVKVVTIHKSKGLAYPLVWLPFIVNFRKQYEIYYHDRKNFTPILDFHPKKESKKLANQECLAEDLRILYVALTRSVYHCSIGIAPLTKGNRKQGSSDLHKTAIGYLLQGGDPGDANFLKKKLVSLVSKNNKSEDISVSLVSELDKQIWKPKKSKKIPLAAKKFTRKIQDNWIVTSYSRLQQDCYLPIDKTLQLKEIIKSESIESLTKPTLFKSLKSDSENKTILTINNLTPHHFPRGAIAGKFLHGLLELLDFSQPINLGWLTEQLFKNGFDTIWSVVLQKWLKDILHTKLNETGVNLASLIPENKQVELQFYLPINSLLQANELTNLVKKYDPISASCPALYFQQVQGMLKGFIDLVFFWEEKFYLLDYKSNWLGENSNSYNLLAMTTSIAENRYDLQYQLYTLALHRYLGHRLTDYNYQRHFGGVIYLFLRGINANYPGNGIFYYRPAQQLIYALDDLFIREIPQHDDRIIKSGCL